MTAETQGELLQQVWREACKHIEIGECMSLLAPVLAGHLPLGVALIRRIDRERSLLETVGFGTMDGTPPPERTRDVLGASLDGMLAWCQMQHVAHSGAQAEVLRLVTPSGLSGEFLAGPLGGADAPEGVLLLRARAGCHFEPRHEALVQELLEPFSVALQNDRRLREMITLREAAEADKRSLLTRLGRDDISETIVGAEAGLLPVMGRVELVARSDVPVLIFGETGSGKEVIARAIHSRSRRSAGPFLRVNCGAIPSELIDSELFGHERGSFTGAINMRKGWFERADGGTLFLDEIGELTAAAQVRLLRILQDGAFERVGGQRQLKVDVRIVAATHRDLQAMVTQGQFREDLWYRLAVFPIHLPALRDHPEDIPALATHFALRACRRFGFAAHVPSPDDLRLLCAYTWPGNVRELIAVIERAAILGDGRRLEVAKALGSVPADGRSQPSTPDVTENGADAPFPTLDEAMAAHIRRALALTGGQIEGAAGAARRLGINPHTLRARMRKLSIAWSEFRTMPAKR